MAGGTGGAAIKATRRGLWAMALWLRRVRVFALVGRSGSGKSFRAHLIAEKRRIELIVDDGLLIYNRTILYGQSSKKESTLVSAVRRALFDEPRRAEEAMQALSTVRFRRVLVVGTSTEMAARIARNLGLPSPSEVFRIEDIATEDQRQAAGRDRRTRGAHSLPLPPVKVRLSLTANVLGTVRALASAVGALRKRRPLPPVPVQAADVPRQGAVVFTQAAVGQMVHHCLQEFDPRLALASVRITRRGALYSLEIRLQVPYGRVTSGRLHELREYFIRSLERHAGILVEEVSLVVQSVSDREAAASAGASSGPDR